jgi:hypothetical protein
MNEPSRELDEALKSVYQSDADSDFRDRVMERLADEPVEVRRRGRGKLAAIAVTACAVVVLAFYFGQAYFGENETDEPAQTDERTASDSKSSPKSNDSSIQTSDIAEHIEDNPSPVGEVVSQAENDAAQSEGAVSQAIDTARRLDGRIVVVLDMPKSIPLQVFSSLPSVSSEIPKGFVLLTGQLINPHERSGEKMVELKIDRVLIGDVKEGEIRTKDEYPHFFVKLSASESFPNGETLVCSLLRKDENWSFTYLRKLTPRFLPLFEATTGENQAKKLRALITPTGMDQEAMEMITRFASVEQIKPLMKEIVRETPALLEAYKGETKPSLQRVELVSLRLEPALGFLSNNYNWDDASLVDLILPCYPPLQDEGDENLRYSMNHHLANICRIARRNPEKLKLTDKQSDGIREVFLKEVRGLGSHWSPARLFACEGLGYFGETATITALLEEQARRPVSQSHSSIATSLSVSCSEANPSPADLLRVKKAWFDAIATMHQDGTLSDHHQAKSHTKSFAKSVASGLSRMELSDSETESLKLIYEETELPWLRSALESFFK